jgi:hypothetical protein
MHITTFSGAAKYLNIQIRVLKDKKTLYLHVDYYRHGNIHLPFSHKAI